MAAYLADIYVQQFGRMDIEIWHEPFAGGLGAGLTLLDNDVVQEVWFCEANPAIAALWRAIIADCDELAATIASAQPSLSAYQEALHTVEAAYQGERLDDQTLGFAAFVVNRCSRSGIVAPGSGPIGGKHQTGRWTVSDRFNPSALAARIRALAPLAHRLRFVGEDGIANLAELSGEVGIEEEMVCLVDPPYLGEGNRLYAKGMTGDQHSRLAAALNATPARWLLTYDSEPAVHQEFYPDRRVLEFTIPHSANRQREDTEYLVFSDDLAINTDRGVLHNSRTRWVRGGPGVADDDQDMTGPEMETIGA